MTPQEEHDQKVAAQFKLFEAELPSLMEKHRDQWVVYLCGPKKFAPTEEEAMSWGVRQLPHDAGFVVAKVAPLETITLSLAQQSWLRKPPRTTHNFWVLVHPAEDIPGVWVARCLELGVVTQGDSVKHAFAMAAEAAAMVLVEDRGAGTASRHRAPDEDWQELWNFLPFGGQIPFEYEHINQAASAAAQMVVSIDDDTGRDWRTWKGWSVPAI